MGRITSSFINTNTKLFKKVTDSLSIAAVIALAFNPLMPLVEFLPAQAAADIIMFDDDFSSGDFSNWTSDSGDWHVETSGSGYGDSNFASSDGMAPSEIILTPTVTGEYNDVHLSFWFQNGELESGDTAFLSYSTNSGATYSHIRDFDSGNHDTWKNSNHGLGASTYNASDLRIKFSTDFDSASKQLDIDDVRLTGRTGDAPTIDSTTPTNGDTISGASVPLTITATDNDDDITTANWRLENLSGDHMVSGGLNNYDGDDTWEKQFNSENENDGDYNLIFIVHDSGGNESSITVPISISNSAPVGPVYRADGGGSPEEYFSTIQEAVDDNTVDGSELSGDGTTDNGDTIVATSGTHNGTINVEGFDNLTIKGEGATSTTIQPTSTLGWNVSSYGGSRQTPVRVVDSTNITFENFTFDFNQVAASQTAGVLAWNSTGTFQDNVLKNNQVADANGGQHEIGMYIRAVDSSHSSRAEITLKNNQFFDLGRVAVNLNDYVDVTVKDNEFYKTVDDFGYGLEVGSESVATVTGNTFHGFGTPAVTDNSSVAGIYIHNSFTYDVAQGFTKQVTVTGNEIYDNQFGVAVGNNYDGYAANVATEVIFDDNQIHDNKGGVLIRDEDKDAGSSVSVTASGNSVENNNTFGYLLTTDGDGDLSASLENEIISGNNVGFKVDDTAGSSSNSSYDINITNSNIISNASNGINNLIPSYTTVEATNNWWGDQSGPSGVGPGTGDSVKAGTTYSPWLCQPFQDGTQSSVNGNCDFDDPQVSFTSPNDGAIVGATDISFELSDNENISQYSFNVNGPNTNNWNTGKWRPNTSNIVDDVNLCEEDRLNSCDESILPSGNYKVRAAVYDGNGNSETSTSVNFILDNDGPVVNITDPAADSVVNEISLDGTIEDQKLDYFNIALNRIGDSNWNFTTQKIKADSEQSLYTLSDFDLLAAAYYGTCEGVSCTSWDGGSELPDGKYTMRLNAYDEFGNRTIYSHNFTLDTTAPSVTFTSPVDGEIVGNTEIGFEINDDTNVKQYSFLVNGPNNNDWNTRKWHPNTTSVDVDTLNLCVSDRLGNCDEDKLPSGLYNVRVATYDGHGNRDISTDINFELDNDGPTVNISDPSPNSTVNNALVDAEISDQKLGFFNIQLNKLGDPDWNFTTQKQQSNTNQTTYTLTDFDLLAAAYYGTCDGAPCYSWDDSSELPYGEYKIRVNAYDEFGNRTIYSHSFTLDDQPPVVFAGADDIVSSDTYTLDGTASDPETNVTSTQWTEISGPGSATFVDNTAVDTEVEVSNYGTYTFGFTVTDAAGNNSTDDVNITFNDPSTGGDGGDNTETGGSGGDEESLSGGQGGGDVAFNSQGNTAVPTVLSANTDNTDEENQDENNESEEDGDVLQEQDSQDGEDENTDEDENEEDSNFWWWLLLIALLGGGIYVYARNRGSQA